jgi:hypothetical protein
MLRGWAWKRKGKEVTTYFFIQIEDSQNPSHRDANTFHLNGDDQIPPSFRIRCVSGEHTGKWLWTMGVSEGSLPFQVTDWSAVFTTSGQFSFHPHFVPEEIAALSISSRELAEGYMRVLKQQDFDCEIISA